MSISSLTCHALMCVLHRAPLLLHRYCYTGPTSMLQQFAARVGVSARGALCHSSRKRLNAVVIVFLLHSVFGSRLVAKSPRAHTPHCAFRLSPVISELWLAALLCKVSTLGMTCWHSHLDRRSQPGNSSLRAPCLFISGACITASSCRHFCDNRDRI